MDAELETVTITKLVHGGQGLGELSDGRKVFVWNALPGETLKVRLIKRKHSYAEAIAEMVIAASPKRVTPKEANYLATSPWQILSFAAENEYKQQIVAELFNREKVVLPSIQPTQHDDREWRYRNKMEYSFWGDEDGIHLALHERGSHSKRIVAGSALAMPVLDVAANVLCEQLSRIHTRAGDLKTIIVRSNQKGAVVAALYTKLERFTELELPEGVQGLRVYYSNPKSPASVPTELLYELGDATLSDVLMGKSFVYNVDSFFQVNPPVFEQALSDIQQHCQAPAVVDMYAGVGTIGLSVAGQAVTLIESDPATAAMARINAAHSGLRAIVDETTSEQALEHIMHDHPLLVDPPRAGLHEKVVAQILTTAPPVVYYLSCNPATQARDCKRLEERYVIEAFSVYNFFPHTPHIESLAILRLL
jgi:23S rRNA (uracil1939-C5)-methyltransferase